MDGFVEHPAWENAEGNSNELIEFLGAFEDNVIVEELAEDDINMLTGVPTIRHVKKGENHLISGGSTGDRGPLMSEMCDDIDGDFHHDMLEKAQE